MALETLVPKNDAPQAAAQNRNALTPGLAARDAGYAANGLPLSIGSAGSRDHSFQDPK